MKRIVTKASLGIKDLAESRRSSSFFNQFLNGWSFCWGFSFIIQSIFTEELIIWVGLGQEELLYYILISIIFIYYSR